MIVEPPIGIIVPSLPPGCARVIIGANAYYNYDNIYYEPYGGSYRVIEKPHEDEEIAKNDKQPEKATSNDYEKVVLDGKTYYKKGDKYYKATVNKDGEIIYEEAGETSKSN